MKNKILLFFLLTSFLYISCQKSISKITYEEISYLERLNTNKIHSLATKNSNAFIFAKMKSFSTYEVFLVEYDFTKEFYGEQYKFVTNNKKKNLKIGMDFEDVISMIGTPAYLETESNIITIYYFQNYFNLLSSGEIIGISPYLLKLQFVNNKLSFKEQEYVSRP